MKAKDYAEEYLKYPSIATLRAIMNDFLEENVTLAEERKVSTDAGMFAIFNEQDQKWRAFARIVNKCVGIEPQPAEEGFSNLLKELDPALYNAWQITKMIDKRTQNRRVGGRQRL